MKKSILSLAVVGLFAMSASAFASKENSGTVINGGIKDSYNTIDNSVSNQGGQGGRGGDGGVGVGVGVGLGGNANATGGSAVIGSGAVRNAIDNANTNLNVNAVTNSATGGQGGSVRDSGNSNNLNVNANSNSNSNTANGGDGGVGVGIGGNASNKNANSATGGNAQGGSVSINVAAPKTYRPPVNSAFAPTIFPTAPCMGSSSVGATGTLFSISGGTTWTSEECMILETARSFDQAGYATDGLAVRCQGKWAKNAPSCKALVAKEAEAVQAAQPTPVAVTAPATAPVKATPVAATKAVTPAVTKPVQQVTVSPNGYYSVNTNPLTK